MLKHLKKIRVIFSLLFFLLTTFLFLDYKELISERLLNSILYLQFVPSFLKFTNLFSLVSAGFILVLIISLVFGRIYCSSICPFGILQDIITWFSGKTRKKKKKKFFKFARPYNILRYSILILTILVFIFGSVILLTLLDPYSNHGRISSNLLRPVFYVLNNLLSNTLMSMNNYSINPVTLEGYNIFSIIFSFSILVLITYFSFKHGRLFCNTICPVGSLLGFVSKYSLFKILIDQNKCTSCTLCERECKSQCINSKEFYVDFTRCVGCFNCLTTCKHDAIDYKPRFKNLSIPFENISTDNEKREFFSKSILFILGFLGLSSMKRTQIQAPTPAQDTTIQEDKTSPVCIPGAGTIEDFNRSCTACHLCVSACPAQCIQPSIFDYGLTGLLQPKMDFHAGFCTFECVRCTDICPSGALLPVSLEEKKLLQLGIAKFIKESCVVETDKTDCGACSEHCPTKAVKMVPYENDLVIPEVDDSICIGCGACEYACPTRPFRAIFVDGNPVHQVADKPEVSTKKKIILDDDFPF